jgi:hypothetical protein
VLVFFGAVFFGFGFAVVVPEPEPDPAASVGAANDAMKPTTATLATRAFIFMMRFPDCLTGSVDGTSNPLADHLQVTFPCAVNA